MKRFLSILLVAVLLIGSLSVAALADTVATITGEHVTTTAGATVKVAFKISEVTYQDYALKLNYDSALTLTAIDAGSASHGGFGAILSTGKIATYDFQEAAASGTLFTATFQVPAEAAVGTKYNVSVSGVTFINQADETLSIGVNGGSITIVAPECEHEYGDWYTVDEAGCENGGSERRDCQKCEHYETRDTDPLGHAWGEWKIDKAASCTEDGLKQRTCSRCGEVEEEIIPSAEGHAWGEWTTVEKETCTKDGLKQRVCGSCGEKQEEVIKATGHVIDKDWEYDRESHWHICTKCGEKFDHDDHDLKELENSKGQKYKKCSVCPYATDPEGDVIDDVPKTGDITPMITTGILVLIGIVSVAAIVFKRKRAN